MLKNRKRSIIGGMVASPTPMMPISGDSTTVIAVRVPGRARASMLAAIHPEVPPPTMAMRRMRSVARKVWGVAGIRQAFEGGQRDLRAALFSPGYDAPSNLSLG